MKYFSLYKYHTMPKNALQKAANELLQFYSHRLTEDKDRFLENIKKEIARLNEKNPRCKPLIFNKWNVDEIICVGLGSHFTVTFDLILVKEDAV